MPKDDALPVSKDEATSEPTEEAAPAGTASRRARAKSPEPPEPAAAPEVPDQQERLRALNEQLRREHERAGKLREHDLRQRH